MFDINPITQLLHQFPTAFIISTSLLGVLVGSFLNVVIYRVPEMMKRQWKRECVDYLSSLQENSQLERQFPSNSTPFNLITPHSQCPGCQSSIKPWMNIPVLSYVLLKGACHQCKQTISLRYPAIELITAIVSGVVAWHFGPTWTCFITLILCWSLISLTMIDFDHQLLPDSITLPLIWLGLLANYFNLYTSLENALLGAVFGYLSLWSIFWAFKIATGKDGMGQGDFKLLSALGAFLGVKMLLPIILLSSLSGTVVGVWMLLSKASEGSQPIPFGPHLAMGGMLCLFFGDTVLKLIGW
ncbi:MAG: A24 family peptidase [Pseudomonadota bacterium]